MTLLFYSARKETVMKYKASEIDFQYWPLWMKVLTFIGIVLFVFIGSIGDICF